MHAHNGGHGFVQSPYLFVDRFGLSVMWPEPSPNKPLVPTAHTSPSNYPPGPLRRHIGHPLDGRAHRESLVGDDLDATYV